MVPFPSLIAARINKNECRVLISLMWGTDRSSDDIVDYRTRSMTLASLLRKFEVASPGELITLVKAAAIAEVRRELLTLESRRRSKGLGRKRVTKTPQLSLN